MADPSARRRGFCPGVWAPMESGDGLLLRVRARRGRISAAQLQGLAAASCQHGNGIIELTRRANLQLRGASPASLPDLQAELLELGLAEESLAAERRPVLLVCPLAGLDPRSARLLEPPLEQLVAEVERQLAAPQLVRGLSEKFLVVLSGGSDVFASLEADLSIELSPVAPALATLSVAGSGAPLALVSCRAGDVPLALERLLSLLGATVQAPARMRDLVAARGIAALRAELAPLSVAAAEAPSVSAAEAPSVSAAEALSLAVAEAPSVSAAGPACLRGAPRFARFSAPPLGYQSGQLDWFSFQLPFGAAPAPAWRAIAELARDHGRGEARLLPGRCVLLPGVCNAARQELVRRAREHHFIVERPAPWLELVACSGAPACRSASADTRGLALELAPLVRARLRSGATLHVSGCEKGCAWGGAADITLLHGPDGYRLGFGADLAQTARSAALSLDAVRARLSRGIEQ